MRIFEVLKTIDPKLQLHDELNPELWSDYKLKPVVSKALKSIAEKFFEYLEIPRETVVKVVVTGSNCNFNWTPWSDIDLHLVLDFSELGVTPEEFAERYFKAAKTVWNAEHDIHIGDYEVELYAQDSKEKHVASGIWSLTDDDWLKKPKKVHVKINDLAVKSKAIAIANAIDSLVDHAGDDPDPANELKAKIRRMRKAGLCKHGEFSVENLVFKALRNNGYLDKLDKAYKGTIDKELSLSRSELKK